MAETELNIKGIIFAFIAVILGAVFLTAIANEAIKTTGDFAISNESMNVSAIANATDDINVSAPVYPTYRNISSITNITNITGELTLAPTTDYVYYTANGSITFLNTTNTVSLISSAGNLTYINYDYYMDEYLAGQSAARTVTTLIILFFALAIVTIAIDFTLKQLGYAGIITKR